MRAVALTAAGVLRAAVVDESLIPLAEKHGLKPLADFRGVFAGMNDVQINRWALDRFESFLHKRLTRRLAAAASQIVCTR